MKKLTNLLIAVLGVTSAWAGPDTIIKIDADLFLSKMNEVAELYFQEAFAKFSPQEKSRAKLPSTKESPLINLDQEFKEGIKRIMMLSLTGDSPEDIWNKKKGYVQNYIDYFKNKYQDNEEFQKGIGLYLALSKNPEHCMKAVRNNEAVSFLVKMFSGDDNDTTDIDNAISSLVKLFSEDIEMLSGGKYTETNYHTKKYEASDIWKCVPLGDSFFIRLPANDGCDWRMAHSKQSVELYDTKDGVKEYKGTANQKGRLKFSIYPKNISLMKERFNTDKPLWGLTWDDLKCPKVLTIIIDVVEPITPFNVEDRPFRFINLTKPYEDPGKKEILTSMVDMPLTTTYEISGGKEFTKEFVKPVEEERKDESELSVGRKTIPSGEREGDGSSMEALVNDFKSQCGL